MPGPLSPHAVNSPRLSSAAPATGLKIAVAHYELIARTESDDSIAELLQDKLNRIGLKTRKAEHEEHSCTSIAAGALTAAALGWTAPANAPRAVVQSSVDCHDRPACVRGAGGVVNRRPFMPPLAHGTINAVRHGRVPTAIPDPATRSGPSTSSQR